MDDKSKPFKAHITIAINNLNENNTNFDGAISEQEQLKEHGTITTK
jgi:hypothetical protein